MPQAETVGTQDAVTLQKQDANEIETAAPTLQNPLEETKELVGRNPNEEGRYSPAPPRVDELSMEEEDESDYNQIIRNARAEREQQAREDALRKAAALAERDAHDAEARGGALATLDQKANSILAKYA
mmetsp:Transcript_5866/g.10447  ORF Transcript_5866/g.10447 Transcript_5866/m.10447 type:complete len:128 (+) Transcript_5866:267-650(+)